MHYIVRNKSPGIISPVFTQSTNFYQDKSVSSHSMSDTKIHKITKAKKLETTSYAQTIDKNLIKIT